jgi:hypothetical protein
MDFDFDMDPPTFSIFTLPKIQTYLNPECVTTLHTRGGYHVLIELAKIDKQFEKTWYNNITSIPGMDMKGDNMIPIPGTYQGGFTPRFI